MPIMAKPRKYLKTFRFCAAFGEPLSLDARWRLGDQGDNIPLEAVLSEISLNGGGVGLQVSSEADSRLLLSMGQSLDLPTLKAVVDIELARVAELDVEQRVKLPTGAVGQLSVWLLGEAILGGTETAEWQPQRRYDITFQGYRWLPLNLDARVEESARERVILTGVRYVLDDAAR